MPNPTRRSFLSIIAGSTTAISTNTVTALAANKPRHIVSMEEWMDAWMADAPREVSSLLYVSQFKDPMWFLLQPITWKPNIGTPGNFAPVSVPTGFVTDFASIPREFWSLLRPDGDYSYAAVFHDFLYWNQTTSKEYADSVLKFAMEDFKIDSKTIWTIYTAVKLFGQSAWDGNAKLKAAGEKRVLKIYPPNPTITWDEWKTKDVFF